MDPATIGAIGSAVSAIGGLFGKSGGQLDLGKLRRSAENNGFNPLTVLRLTGGQGFVSQAQPSPLQAMGQAMVGFSDSMIANENREQAAKESDARIAAMGKQSMQRDAAVRAVTRTVSFPITTGVGKLKSDDPEPNLTDLIPKSKWADTPTSEIPFVRVRLPNGQYQEIRADMAEAAKLREGSTMTPEHYEALTGEISSELAGFASVMDATLGFGTHWIKKTFTLAKEKAAKENAIRHAAVFGPYKPVSLDKQEKDMWEGWGEE